MAILVKWRKKAVKTLNNYIFIISTIWKATPGQLIIIIILTLIESFLPLIPMFLMKKILNLLANSLANSVSQFKLLFLLGGITVCGIFMRFVGNLKDLFGNLISNIVGKHITYIIQRKASQLDLEFFDTPEYYQRLDDARRALGRRWDFLILAPITSFGQVTTLCTMIIILATFNVWLVLIIILGVTPNIIIQIKIRKKLNQFYQNQIPENRKIEYTKNLLSERFFAKEVRIFGLCDYLLQMSDNLYREQYSKLKATKIWGLKISIGWDLLSTITLLSCQIYIAIQTLQKKITLGDWQFYVGAAQSIQSNLNTVFNIVASSYEEELYADILRSFMNTKPRIEMDNGLELPISDNPPIIEFKGVSFSYPDSSRVLLKNLNFTIYPGERIALVGLNGAGKSSIIKILTRLYDPIQGQVLFDGVDIKKYRAKDIYKLFGIIFQDYAQYAFTIKENISISYLEKMADFKSIREAAAASGVDKIAEKLPNSYDTYITKEFDLNGYSNLSVGEWQKIALARGFFRNSPIVILDEPTSSLDPEAEHDVYNQFVKLCENKTAILVSHRLSSVKMVDRIFLIKNGEILESGTHRELMTLNREYAYLFRLQAEQYNI